MVGWWGCGGRGGAELGDGRWGVVLLFRGGLDCAGKDVIAGQVDEPLDFHAHTVTVQGCLGQVVNEGRDGGLVTAVQRAQGDLVR